MQSPTKRTSYVQDGMRDGIPIMMGYLAVGFSVGIAAKNAGMNVFQGFLLSFLNIASAGEYANITVIAADAAYIEIAIITLITNARYMLMSCALSQRFDPKTPFYHRLLVGFGITDEIFGITIAQPGTVKPAYVYGAFLVALPGWDIGTALGVWAGNVLPTSVTSALSVALFGMFLAIIIPPARKHRPVLLGVIASFILSCITTYLPLTASISGGTRTIILTVVIAGVLAFLCPVPQEEDDLEHDA